MQRFGEKLRTLRTREGMTLRELAEVLGYSNHGYLGLLETGKKTPTVEFVMKVARFFGVTTDQLLWDEVALPSAGPAGAELTSDADDR
jgi:transcriptional regulator with XRE-family HTH domain